MRAIRPQSRKQFKDITHASLLGLLFSIPALLERFPHEISLLALDVEDSLLHSSLHDKTPYSRLACLAKPVDAIDSLVLDRRSPPYKNAVSISGLPTVLTQLTAI